MGLGKYLTALSTSFIGLAKPSTVTPARRQPSAKRKCLSLLYLVNDLLHHAKIHSNDASLSSKLQPQLVGLFNRAASFRSAPKHQRKLQSLLDIWEERQYYSAEYIDKLREATRLASEGGEYSEASRQIDHNGAVDIVTKSSRTLPFLMPATHGDQGMPWYDLPAANLMPHIIPNSTRPINPELVKPLQFIAGPADETLANAVRIFLREVADIFGAAQNQDDDHETLWDIDELGQAIYRDEMSGEIMNGEGYYGWSKTFCEKMKRRQKRDDFLGSLGYKGGDFRARSTSRTRSRSRTSGGSSQPYKRRRYRDSEEDRSRSRGRSVSRHRRRTWSTSGSASRERGITARRDAQRDRSRESIQRSPSPGRSHSASDGSHSMRAQSSSPMRKSLGTSRGDLSEKSRASNLHDQDSQNFLQSQQAFVATGHVFSANIIPIPPPPPPHYQGTWPPPPPPAMVQYGQQGGSWPPPLPPFLHGMQQWSSMPYGQSQAAAYAWPKTSSQGSSGSGAHGGQGQGGSGVPQQQYPGGGSGYTGYGSNGRGRGWS